MYRTKIIIAGIALLIFITGIAQFLFARQAVSPVIQVATSTPNQSVGTTTTKAVVSEPPVNNVGGTYSLSIAEGDNIQSWDFKGAYTGNAELVAKAQSEIKQLSELLVTATSSKMILSVGIANQYELLGDGKNQYDYLGRAIQASPENGLPWHNLGVLMERLGAYKTARIAYEKSTLVQPEFKFYHYAYIEFLISRTKDDVANIEKAFAFAEKNIGKTSNLSELRAEWEKP